jgi:PAS domain S-box-containing protein
LRGGPSDELPLSDDTYRALLEEIPAVTYLISTDDPPRVRYVSPQAEAILGHSPERWRSVERYWLNVAVHPSDRGSVESAWRQADATGTFRCLYRVVAEDRVIWVLDEASLVNREDGRPLYWRGVMFDLTAEQQQLAGGTEEALRRSEARYRALVEDIPAVVYEMGMDDERRTLYVSPHVEQVLGYSRDEWLEQPDIWMELLHQDDREIELAAHDLHGETGEPWSREYRLIAADGHLVWVRDQAVLVRDERGRPLFWQGVMLDVTEQKKQEEELRRANDELEFRVLARTSQLADANEMMSLEIEERRRVERQLREAEERYRHIVEDVPAVVYTWRIASADDHAPPRDYVSPQIEALLGYTPQEWVEGELWNERMHPHDYDAVFAATDRSRTSGEPFSMEYRYLAKDGRVVWVLDQARLIARDRHGRPRLFQGVVLDITARKQAEAKAEDAEARYRQLVEGGSVIAYVLGRAEPGEPRPLTYISPQIERILGYTDVEWLEESGLWGRSLHPDDRDRMHAASRAIDAGGPWSEEYRLIARDGRVVWVHDEGGPGDFDEAGPTTFHGVLLDITERKASEDLLRDAEERYRSLVEGLPAIPWTEVVDAATGRSRITYIGPQATNVLGYSPEELIAEPDHFERLLHPGDAKRMLARAAHCARTGEPWDEVFRMVARDGRTVWVSSRATMVSDDDGRRVWQGITFDITAAMEHDPEVAVEEDEAEAGRRPRR